VKPLVIPTVKGQLDTLLGCTLSHPKQGGPHPGVVLLSDAGAQDRHGTTVVAGKKHQPYALLADVLTRRGLGVLRCDDRGVGASKGRETMRGLAERAKDAAALVTFLRGQVAVDKQRVGVAGFGEGSAVAAAVAAKDAKMAFVVALSGLAAKGSDTLADRLRRRLLAKKVSEADVARALEAQARVMDLVRDNGDVDAMTKAVAAKVALERKLLGTKTPAQNLQVRLEVVHMMSASGRALVLVEPGMVWSRIKAPPVLALYGKADVDAHPDLHAPLLEKALGDAGNPDVTTTRVDGSPTQLDRAMANAVSDWVLPRVGISR